MPTTLVIHDEDEGTETITASNGADTLDLYDFDYVYGTTHALRRAVLDDLERFADTDPEIRSKAYGTIRDWVQRKVSVYAQAIPGEVPYVEAAVSDAAEEWKANANPDAVEAWENR